MNGLLVNFSSSGSSIEIFKLNGLAGYFHDFINLDLLTSELMR
jgi:hypothetical protein